MKTIHSVAIFALVVAIVATVSVTVGNRSKGVDSDGQAQQQQTQNAFEIILNDDNVTSTSDEESLLKIIDSWLHENNLNSYGDPIGTVYMGGTPLFDMTTGTSVSRFSYLMEKFQDQPWIRA